MMPTPPPPPRPDESDGFKATIVLIGMRGAGKTHLGRAAATALGLPFIDMDHLYEAEHGKIMDTVNTEGWPTFRQREVALLKRTLAEDAEGGRGRVVACGGGIVETEAGRELLRAHWPVVQAMKPIDDVEWYLGIDASRPSLGEPPRVAYARRAGWYDACADFDHMAAPRRFLDHDAAAAAFVVHVRRACGLVPPTPLPPAPSFALSLACADVAAAMPLPSALWANVDAVEIRADLLSSHEPAAVRLQLAVLRAACPCPLIFTLRTAAAGGRFGGTHAEYLALNAMATRAGVEYITLEADCIEAEAVVAAADGACLTTASVAAAARRLGVRVIGLASLASLAPARAHTTTRLSAEEMRVVVGAAVEMRVVVGAAVERAGLAGCADMRRVEAALTEPTHAAHLYAAVADAAGALGCSHFMALSTGPGARMSSLLNGLLTPVTHPLLPLPQGEGALDGAEPPAGGETEAGAFAAMSATRLLDMRRELGLTQ